MRLKYFIIILTFFICFKGASITVSAAPSLEIILLEEFPTQDNLEKIHHLNRPFKLILAAPSISTFKQILTTVPASPHITEIGYWPTLSQEEGYWLSAFADPVGLNRVIYELQNSTDNLTVLWDAELPQNKKLLIQNLPHYFQNYRLIKQFVENHPPNINLLIATTPDRGILDRWVKQMLGLSFSRAGKFQQLEMLYGPSQEKYLSSQSIPAFGLTAPGVEKPQLTSKMSIKPVILKTYLNLSRERQIPTVAIYRLGGIGNDFAKIINSFN